MKVPTVSGSSNPRRMMSFAMFALCALHAARARGVHRNASRYTKFISLHCRYILSLLPFGGGGDTNMAERNKDVR